MVDSLDDLKTSQSIRGHRLPKFEVLDAKTASSLKKIIQNSNFKKRINLTEQKAQVDDRFFRGRQIAFMIYEYFRVTGAHEAVLDCSDTFRITLHGDDILDLDTRWDDVSWSTSLVSNDRIVGQLVLRIRESDQLKTVLAFYDQ